MNTIKPFLLVAVFCLGAWAQDHEYYFPGVDNLPVIEGLPDPFIMGSGSRVETLKDWEEQRDYLKAMIQHYEYGFRPPVPEDVTVQEASSNDTGWTIEKTLTFTVAPPSGKNFSFTAGMRIPKGVGPFPIVIKNDRGIHQIPASEEGVNRGYIMMDYVRTDLDPDLKLNENGNVGPAEAAYPDYSWATVQIWSWGFSVIIDWLETQDYVDITKIAVTGQSRGGKTALLAGVMDERIALTIASGSGAGGCGNFRFAEKWGQPDGAESLGRISSTFTHWFVPELNTFAGRETSLPFDQHTVKALVAPRALLCTDALADYWANPWGSQQTHEAAKEVWKFFGVPERIGIHYRDNGHDQNEEDIIALLDFADFIFKGEALPADYYAENFDIDESQWSWESPTPLVRGCTDSTYEEFNPEAVVDNGSCRIVGVIPGQLKGKQLAVRSEKGRVVLSGLLKDDYQLILTTASGRTIASHSGAGAIDRTFSAPEGVLFLHIISGGKTAVRRIVNF